MTATTERQVIGEWDWFSPYGEWENDPFGWVDAQLLGAEVDGVEYITDKFLFIRRDLLPAEYPREVEVTRPESLNATVAKLFTKKTKVPEDGLKMHPFYADVLAAAGLRFEERGNIWDLYLGDEQVGCLAPARGGVRPDDLTPRARAVQKVIAEFTGNRHTAWAAAQRIEVDVLSEVKL